MPYYDTNIELGKSYDHNGGIDNEIAEIYEHKNGVDNLIYKNQSEIFELSQETRQEADNLPAIWTYSRYAVNGYSTINITEFSPAVSFGEAETQVYVLRNNVEIVWLRNRYVRYFTSEFPTGVDNSPPIDVFSGLQNGDEIILRSRASYFPNVSGQHTSASFVKFFFS